MKRLVNEQINNFYFDPFISFIIETMLLLKTLRTKQATITTSYHQLFWPRNILSLQQAPQRPLFIANSRQLAYFSTANSQEENQDSAEDTIAGTYEEGD